MRYEELSNRNIVTEAVAYRGRGFNVIANPTKTQFQTLLTRLKGDVLRGLLDDHDGLYLWDAYFAEHQQIGDVLGIPDALNFECTADQVILNYAKNDKGSKLEQQYVKRLMGSHALQRLYGPQVPVAVEHW